MEEFESLGKGINIWLLQGFQQCCTLVTIAPPWRKCFLLHERLKLLEEWDEICLFSSLLQVWLKNNWLQALKAGTEKDVASCTLLCPCYELNTAFILLFALACSANAFNLQYQDAGLDLTSTIREGKSVSLHHTLAYMSCFFCIIWKDWTCSYHRPVHIRLYRTLIFQTTVWASWSLEF